MDDFLGRNDEQMQCRGILHIVEAGDTLYKIGKKYGVPVSRVMYANPYVNVYNLQIGDEICVPVMVPRVPAGDTQKQPAMGDDRTEGYRPAQRNDRMGVHEPAMQKERMEASEPAMQNDYMEGYVPAQRNDGMEGYEPAQRNDRMEGYVPAQRNDRMEGYVPAQRNDRMGVHEPVMQKERMQAREPAMWNERIEAGGPQMRNERIEAGGPQMRNERTEAGGPQMRNEHMGKNEPEIWDARGGMGRPAMREDHMGTGQPAIWDNHMDGQGPVMPDCMEQRNPAMQNPYMGKCTYGNTQPPSDSYFRQHTVPVQDSDVQRYMTPAREKSHADPAPAAESAYHSMGGMSYEGGMGFSCEPAKEGQDNSTPQSEGTAYMGNFGADIQQPERNGMENPAETTEEPDSNNRQEASDEPAAEAKNKMEVSGCSFCY